MATERWLMVTAGCLSASVALQLIAMVIPGWIVDYHPITDTKVYMGLMYVVSCPKDECKTESIVDYYESMLLSFTGVIKYSVISSLLQTILTLILCSMVTGLAFTAIRKGSWFEHYTTFTLLFLTISNTIQWMIVAGFSNSSVLLRLNHNDGAGNTSGFPFGVFLYALGSTLVSIVLAMHVVKFWKKHVQSGLFRYGNV